MAIGAWLRGLLTRQAPEAPFDGANGADPTSNTAVTGGVAGGRDILIGSPERGFFTGAAFAASPYWAENLAAVVSAVTIISRTIASLPWLVYRGQDEIDDHPVARLLRRPDGDAGLLGLPDFVEWWIGSTLLSGNGLAAIDDDGRGAPTALRPVPWSMANPLISARARVSFQITGAANLPWWPGPLPTIINATDALWLRDRTDGLFGRSALSRAPQVLGLAHEAQQFAAGMFGSGVKLSGVVRHPGRLSKEASDRIATSWHRTYDGSAATSRVAVLEEGMDFTPLSMTLEDAELLASRKFQTEEIARLFNIPLPILNIWDHSTFTNSDTASQWFGQLTLAPWCKKIEGEFGRVLFNDPAYRLVIDLAELMRGSFATRIASEISLVRAGILSADEVRVAEGWPARGGAANELVAQATGGRPLGTEDGAGDSLPSPNGSGRGNGAANGAAGAA
jgi:HK97 family phage portal protein